MLLLMPGAQALDAVGSVSGIRSREARLVTRHYQFFSESGTGDVKPFAGALNAQCYLKRAVPTPVTSRCWICGKRKSAQEETVGEHALGTSPISRAAH